MRDRSDRFVVAVVGFFLLLGGSLAACLGAGLFGAARTDNHVFGPTVARWWDEGGWESFAVVTAIGVAAVAFGAYLALAQVHRNDGRQRTPTLKFPQSNGARGETTLRSAALSHNLETDLKAIADVHDARVGLFGRYPTIEMRAILGVGDGIDLDDLPAQVDAALGRLQATTGARPDPVQITVRFKARAGSASSTRETRGAGPGCLGVIGDWNCRTRNGSASASSSPLAETQRSHMRSTGLMPGPSR